MKAAAVVSLFLLSFLSFGISVAQFQLGNTAAGWAALTCSLVAQVRANQIMRG